MGVVELALFPAVVLAYAALARAGRRAPLPGWTDVLPIAVVAWIVGIQGLLSRRQPDYMAAYLVEARRFPVAVYAAWAVASVFVAWGVSTLFLRSRNASPPRVPGLALGIALLAALVAVALWPRLQVIGSTLEMEQGILRPLAAQPAVRSLIVLSAIASFTPVVGAGLLVMLDGLLGRRRRQ